MLKPIETDSRFQLVCYDLAGPFIPTSSRGNKYVLIVVDHFSHWVELVALRDITAISIAMALYEEWCCRYGVPERFHSDGATNVHGDIMKELSRHLGIEKSKSSRLHPQGDGMAEAFVKQTKSCIQKQVDQNGVNWDLFLQPTAFAIRSNIGLHTQLTPAELVLGSKLRQPVDTVFPSHTKSFQHGQSKKFAAKLRDRIKQCTVSVNNNLKKSRDVMKTSYDKSAKRHNFNVGDEVMLWKPYKKKGLSRCFQPNWDGPWHIIEHTSETNCKINKGSQELNVHFNQLKRCSPRNVTLEYVDTPKIPTNPVLIDNTFNHYLEDFYDDEIGVESTGDFSDGNLDETVPYDIVDEEYNGQQGNIQINNTQVAENSRIDRSWVSVDERNIIPGQRTRGARMAVDR